MTTTWRQLNVAFPNWASAERDALTHLIPHLTTAEGSGTISQWFFLRKAPCWRIRYHLTDAPGEAGLLSDLAHVKRLGHLHHVTPVVYEPETHAFGGEAAMATAHRLFHHDSRHLLAHLTQHPAAGHRRELSILLCTTMLRAAQLDWYEQGDVWARVADHREPPAAIPEPQRRKLRADLRHLLAADISRLTHPDNAVTVPAPWLTAFADAGRDLAAISSTGRLHRGLRAVLAHHVIFAWNRLGLPHAAQATLATNAKAAIFGPDPTTDDEPAEDTRP
ncbi:MULTISPECIES: thiopeptide-type bacteriocin biosynthesis protein [unclassified Streptomyces]|uniref:thiopeptide-type bacteriocin biosynthesis protein n=1 Tax=unclassified Streptomyces TaxID=2593676 RepID=UPI000CD4D201|nr:MULTISPECIES: thiopeptide-type bacteriocin biosynthesis protein [unclassified Streptomyces]